MKKIMTCLIFAGLLIASGCNNIAQKENQSQETGNESIVSQEVNPVEYTIYYDSDMSALTTDAADTVKLKSWSSISQIGIGNEIAGSTVPERKTFEIEGKTYEVYKTKSREDELALLDEPLLAECGKWDEYEYGKVIAQFGQDNGKLKMFLDLSVKTDHPAGHFTEEEARQRADKIVKELYGAEFFEKYSFWRTLKNTAYNTYDMRVEYMLKIGDYDTEDTVYVSFNLQGELEGIYARKMGYFDKLSETVTQERIVAAEAKVEEVFSGYKIGEGLRRLVIDAKGNCYLQKIIYSEENKSYAVYINIL